MHHLSPKSLLEWPAGEVIGKPVADWLDPCDSDLFKGSTGAITQAWTMNDCFRALCSGLLALTVLLEALHATKLYVLREKNDILEVLNTKLDLAAGFSNIDVINALVSVGAPMSQRNLLFDDSDDLEDGNTWFTEEKEHPFVVYRVSNVVLAAVVFTPEGDRLGTFDWLTFPTDLGEYGISAPLAKKAFRDIYNGLYSDDLVVDGRGEALKNQIGTDIFISSSPILMNRGHYSKVPAVRVPTGLNNHSNTCFCNAGLQCLFAVRHFRHQLAFEVAKRPTLSRTTVARQLDRIFYAMESGRSASRAQIEGLFNSIRGHGKYDGFRVGKQSDVAELVEAILSSLNTEFGKAYFPSPFASIFGSETFDQFGKYNGSGRLQPFWSGIDENPDKEFDLEEMMRTSFQDNKIISVSDYVKIPIVRSHGNFKITNKVEFPISYAS